MVRVTISRRDTADTATIAEMCSLHVQSISLLPGTEVGCSCGVLVFLSDVEWTSVVLCFVDIIGMRVLLSDREVKGVTRLLVDSLVVSREVGNT